MKKCLSLLVMLILSLTLTGCWGKVEVNELTTASAIGIDKTENGYKVTAQVINYQAFTKQASTKAPIFTNSAEGATVFEALRNLTLQYSSKVFIAHFQLLVFSEDLAKEGIEECLYFFYKDPQARHKFQITVIKGDSAENVLKIQTPMKNNPASEIISTMQSGEKYFGIGFTIHVDELLTRIRSNESDPVITGIQIMGDPDKGSENKNNEKSSPTTKIEVANLALFNNDQLVGWLTQEQAQGFSFIQSNIETTVVPAKFDDDSNLSFEVFTSDTTKSFSLKDNKPTITIKVNVSGHIAYPEQSRDAIAVKEVEAIEKQVSENIKEKIISCLEVTQEYRSDILEFGQFIHRKDRAYWHQVKDNFDEVYSTIDFNVEVTTEVARRTY